jgi:hypothetical protein
LIYNFIIFKFYFLSNLILFFIDFLYIISSFNVKFIENWASWLSLRLIFNELRVLEINLSLEGPIEFAWFFYHLFELIFLSFIIQHLFNWILGAIIFIYLLSIKFSTNFKNDLGYHRLFNLSFFIEFSSFNIKFVKN